MSLSVLRNTITEEATAFGHISPRLPVAAEMMTPVDRAQVLAFLSERPFHTFGLTGLIRDNGLVSPLNRGSFYACRDENGNIDGVALIGYNTVMEVRSDASIKAFAQLARACPHIYLMLAEEAVLRKFWHHYCSSEDIEFEDKRYALLKQSWPIEVRDPISGLRKARLADLDLVVLAHAQSGIEETGVNGLEQDPLGFPKRCARRIEKGHTWVWIENGKLIFKVEVLTDTPELIYLESIWIAPEERNKGYGLRCLAQLGREFLKRSSAICLLVQEQNIAARLIYEQAGYKNIGRYQAIFLSR
jgi:predicted GNAT family acetyltransferase